MQEGTLALMQLAKTSAALADLDRAGILTIAVICDPTYAGVAASYASLPDVIIAEPGARMGFTGPRVIEQTIGQRLPEGFQTAEFLLEHGLVDDIVPRSGLRAAIARLLTVGPSPEPADGSADGPAPGPAERRREAAAGPLIRTPEDVASREPWDAVQLARNPGRPTTLDYLAHLLDWFAELHGDRMSGDCPAVVGGLGQLGGRPVVVIGHQKGHSTAELSSRGFGMPTPAGYRKAARLMRLAAKLGIPVITFVDTPGTHPGIEAEEGGQAIAIAENLRLMSQLPVPIVTVITGEGGSGGALALGVADRVLCLASSVYSVISPEGCAAILWRDRGKAPEAAEALRIDAAAQLRLGVVDAVVPEPDEGAHENPSLAARLLRDSVTAALDELAGLPAAELLRGRRERYREIGIRMAGAHEDG
jgi:acetyl-CoA carboxylase carboxyl transferase subunit beta